MDYFTRLIRPNVLSLAEYVPGANAAREDMVKLSLNENGFGTSEAVRAAIARSLKEGGCLDSLSRYPDSDCSALRNALSRLHGLPPEWFIIGNGLDDVISMLSLALLAQDREVILPELTFSVYASCAQMMGASVIRVPMRRDLSIDTETMADAVTSETAMIFLCNPNNPTGKFTRRRDFDELLARLESLPTQPLLVVDEAYADFVNDEEYPEATLYSENRRHVVVLRTFSKLYGLAGLRIGYAIADPELIRYLYRVRQPFTVGALAQVAACTALESKEAQAFTESSLQQILTERGKLEAALAERGIIYIPSQTNFVLAFTDRNADELRNLEKALAARDVLVRVPERSGQPCGLRITIGTPRENERFMAALDSILDGSAGRV